MKNIMSIRATIIGAGVTGVGVLRGIAETLPQAGKDRLSRVDIIERSEQIGAGMPHGHANNQPEHVLNVRIKDMELDPGDFPAWLDENRPIIKDRLERIFRDRADLLCRRLSAEARGGQAKLQERLLAQALHKLDTTDRRIGHYSRIVYGWYLEDCFAQLCDRLRSMNVDVVLHGKTEATDLKPKTGSGYQVSMHSAQGQTEIEADQVVLTTGHWQRDNATFQGQKIQNIWPSQNLVDELWDLSAKLTTKPSMNIAILGSSLSAIDALKTVISAGGGLIHEDTGKVQFHQPELLTTLPGGVSRQVKVDFISRNGLLPVVRGRQSNYTNQHLTLAAINKATQNGIKPLKLATVWKLLKKDLDAAYASYGLSNPYKNWKSFTTRDSSDPFKQLATDLQQAEKGDAPDGTLIWQTVYIQAGDAFFEAYRHLTPVERKMFDTTQLTTEHFRKVGPIPQEVARELLALNREGFLSVKRTDALSPAANPTYDVILEGRGQERDHKANPSPLYRDVEAMANSPASQEALWKGDEFAPGIRAAGMATLAFGTSLAFRCFQLGVKTGRGLIHSQP